MARRLIDARHDVVAFDAQDPALERVALGARPAASAREVADRTATVMVSGPRSEFDTVRAVLETLGRPFYLGEKPGSAQTMKLAHNLLAANVLAATAEVVVMGAKAGLDPAVMIDVLNAGSGATSASRDKFPRAILPRTFDYGFATGLMVKDVRLYLEEAEALGVPMDVARVIGRLWEAAERDEGPDADFTTVIKPLEKAAGVTVGPSPR